MAGKSFFSSTALAAFHAHAFKAYVCGLGDSGTNEKSSFSRRNNERYPKLKQI